jgi:hypothetical protein
MLPIYSTTWPMAHAIAQDWARALRSGGVQPRDYETVRTWATAFAARSPAEARYFALPPGEWHTNGRN